mmetsp:Transcript_19929/g.25676  ORF Transcript_19929/g.25676 Transcript_19929/m.25676 type:complete len:187 (+) Transcript_19929:170-730(+)|eukprot:CAMPEP_0198145482 /NCGR_PEP_ID=MMETSP1443-20131203/23795_1 /TAXON_ID=186043 /ORGANISM="Entomoneis sp., Strain CCMP2396" /LENGTH=186 /DNA_ID=CAMNT_0043809147 /DNA_START=73 /DNA_END=633 /DNA_ORIENTATION=+
MSARANMMKIANRLARHTNIPKPAKEAAKTKTRWNIVRGDKVQVIGNHKEKGKQGTVMEVKRKTDRIVIKGVNLGKKNVKGNPDKGIKGRIIEEERSIPSYLVSLLDPIKNIPTRIHYEFLEDGSKVRVAKKSGAIIPKPELLKHRKRPIRFITTESDTVEDDAWAVTYILPGGPKKDIEARGQSP